MKDDFQPLRPEPAFVPVEADQPQINQDFMPHFADADAGNEPPTSGGAPSVLPPAQTSLDDPQSPKKAKGPKAWWNSFQALDKKKKVLVIVGVSVVLALLGGALWYFVLKSDPPAPTPVVKEEEPPAPTTLASPLTGVQVKPDLTKMPVTGVMIENSPDARPQSGLYDAGVVFEAIAEGGITRFLALFQESKPEYIGPVRSVRPYYLDFLAPHDAPIAHAGGSGQALAEISAQGIKDLEAFQNPNYYQRVSNRYAPHNLYTGRSKLLELQKSKGWTASKFNGFVRKAEKKAATPKAKSIDFSISSFLYNVHYDYDAKTNSYKRVLGGKPHTDEKARKQINPKVVVALVMSHGYSGIYSVYGTKGSGTAFIFQDGTVTKGVWEKKNRTSQFKFGDANKAPLGLNAGQTWLTLVSSAGAVTYK
jgi:hypothetical protein